MAQTGFTPIQLYRSSTPGSSPSAVNLADGELAINTADGKLFYKDNAGVVQVLAVKMPSSVLPIANGGTGATTAQSAAQSLAVTSQVLSLAALKALAIPSGTQTVVTQYRTSAGDGGSIPAMRAAMLRSSAIVGKNLDSSSDKLLSCLVFSDLCS